jgi:hypothetical protein
MPSVDWQFAVVSFIALGAVSVLVRRLTSAFSIKRGKNADPACAHCATNERHREASPTARTTTTPVVSLRDLRETARKE